VLGRETLPAIEEGVRVHEHRGVRCLPLRGERGCYSNEPVSVVAQPAPKRSLPVESLIILAILTPLLMMNVLVGLGKAIASRIGRRLVRS